MIEYLIINLIMTVPALSLAVWRNNVLHKRGPSARGFIWGYFTGFRILLVGTTLCASLLLIGESEDVARDEAIGLAVWVAVVLMVPGAFIPLRHRWAWIMYTACSMNPVLWMINGSYIRNRWKEIGDTRSRQRGRAPISTIVVPSLHTESAIPLQPIPLRAPSTDVTASPVAATPKRGVHTWLLGFLVGLGLLVVGLPLGLYFGGKALVEYARQCVAQTPLYCAVAANNIAEIDRLLAAGANPDEKAIMGHSPLIMAARSDYSLIAEHLLTAGANPNQKDSLQWAPLHHAVKPDSANLDMIAILMRHGADVNITDGHLRTPLHRAAQFGHVEAVRLLLRLGADPNLKDENGWTPLDRGAAHPAVRQVLGIPGSPEVR